MTDTIKLPRQDCQGLEAEVEIVAGDEREGIGHEAADQWNHGGAFELWRGEAIRKSEGDTWECPSGGQWTVVKNGDDEEWEEKMGG